MSRGVPIALVPSAFHPSFGGVEEVARQSAHRLRDRGFDPLVVTNRWPKNLPAAGEFESIPVRRHVFRVPERNVKQYAGALLTGGPTLRAVCRQLRNHGAEMIHAHCVSSNVHYALKAKRRLGLPLVLSLHGELTMDAGGIFQNSAFAKDLMRRALAEADAITACSARSLAEAEAFHGEPLGGRARVVYSGIRVADFDGVQPHRHPKPYVLALGRHVRQKGFDVLLRAFSQSEVKASHDLILAGDGPEHAALQALAADLKVPATFPGRVDHDAAVRLFAGCSFFVLPSRVEPMGIVNLEAMAAGRAVVASDVGGVPELVERDRTGLLVPPENPAALADAMNRVALEEDLRNRLGAAGRARVGRFDWDRITDQFIQIYESVLPQSAAVATA